MKLREFIINKQYQLNKIIQDSNGIKFEVTKIDFVNNRITAQEIILTPYSSIIKNISFVDFINNYRELIPED